MQRTNLHTNTSTKNSTKNNKMVNSIFSTASATNCCCCLRHNLIHDYSPSNDNDRIQRKNLNKRRQVGNKHCNTIITTTEYASQCQYIEQQPRRPTQIDQTTKQLLVALLVVLVTLSQLATCQQHNHRHEDLRSRIHNNQNNNRPSNLSQGSASSINNNGQQQPSTRQLQQVQRSAPVILSKHEEFILPAGSNVTLACSARGVPAPTFVWFQDNKNIQDDKNVTGTTYSNNNNTTSDQPNAPPPSTDLLEERRYIIEQDTSSSDISTSYLLLFDLKLTDTSVFLCWVENEAGYAIGNFSLTITETQPEPQISAIGSQVIVFILLAILLTATIVCLLVLKITGNRSSSSSSSSSTSSSASDMKKSAVGDVVSTPTKDMPGDEGHDGHSSYTMADSELGFMKQLRSGIINIENHSMSPALQFNTQVINKNMNNNNYHHTNHNNNIISMNSAQDRHSKIRQQEQWDSRQHDYLVGESDADEDLQSQTDSAMTTQMLQMPQMQPQLLHNNNPYLFQQHQQHIPPYHMAPTHVGHLQQQQQQQHQHQHMQQIPQMPQVSQIPHTLNHHQRLLQSSHEQLQQQQQQDPFAKYMMLAKKPEAVSQMPQSFI